MTYYVIRLWDIAGSPYAPRLGSAAKAAALAEVVRAGKPKVGAYLKSYNPDGYDGMGEVAFTNDVNKAMRFSNQGAAVEFWQLQSKTHPLRPDGKPNRPLTAFNVTIERKLW